MRTTFAWLLALAALPVLADQVEMQNGDRYTGRVLSLSDNCVVLQNEILGRITLPRSKITLLSVGSAAPTAAAVGSPAASLATASGTNRALASPKSIIITNGDADLAGAGRRLVE
ncbi:MAG: hypothetical protein ACLQVY_24810 [Limisphaerales bacterium]